MSVLQAQAILFGLALGDVLGKPTEFLELNEIKSRYGEKGIQELPEPALFTDDTQMTIALTEGILEAGLLAPIDYQMDIIAKQFVKWSNSPENNRAPGATCMQGIARYKSGLPWRESGVKNSKGCGSAMRVATLGYLYQYDVVRLREVALNSGIITHGHPTAQAASIGAAYLVKLALDQVPISQWITQLMMFTSGISDEFDQALRRVGHVLSWGSEEYALSHIGEGWVGEEAVALALYCVMKYPDDYVLCLQRAANTNGDSDSIASIAGGISGALLGIQAIPEVWQNRCEKANDLRDLAQRMANIRSVFINDHTDLN